eukprot:Seg1092.7 transcript_id=Seg1092.7/GoldUCD/mRNA.D3Y31 product="Brain-specific serine protease 4" protein_id=Seg1092.7/GoldUCD/D3Y31
MRPTTPTTMPATTKEPEPVTTKEIVESKMPPIPSTKELLTPPPPTKPPIKPTEPVRPPPPTPPIPVRPIAPFTLPPPSADLNSEKCGRPARGVIVGGSEALKGQWPWMVAIAKKGSPRNIHCGGTLITDRWVMSAAHCFKSESSRNPTNWVLRVGERDLLTDGMKF